MGDNFQMFGVMMLGVCGGVVIGLLISIFNTGYFFKPLIPGPPFYEDLSSPFFLVSLFFGIVIAIVASVVAIKNNKKEKLSSEG